MLMPPAGSLHLSFTTLYRRGSNFRVHCLNTTMPLVLFPISLHFASFLSCFNIVVDLIEPSAPQRSNSPMWLVGNN